MDKSDSILSPFQEPVEIHTTEMHTAGEPVRVIESGHPASALAEGTILDKRRQCKEKLDHFRKLLMYEPRGHFDMYGALIVKPNLSDADIAVIFMHNEGYSTMCGHAVIALGRYAVDNGYVKEPTSPETKVNIQCPCGLVEAYVSYDVVSKKTGAVRFYSVPAFVFSADLVVEVPDYGAVQLDISYGGAFYALVVDKQLGVDVSTTRVQKLVDAADAVTEAVKKQVVLEHPDSPDLGFLYGTIITDGKDAFSTEPTANICVFADRQVDRAPTGSGVTARIALQYHKQLLELKQLRQFASATTQDIFTGQAVAETSVGGRRAVVVEVQGQAYYTGKSVFTLEPEDKLGHGFLLR